MLGESGQFGVKTKEGLKAERLAKTLSELRQTLAPALGECTATQPHTTELKDTWVHTGNRKRQSKQMTQRKIMPAATCFCDRITLREC